MATELLRVCAWCDRAIGDDDKPLPIKVSTGRTETVSLTHGICLTCRANFNEELAELNRVRQLELYMDKAAAFVSRQLKALTTYFAGAK
jgi:hypothetical protein